MQKMSSKIDKILQKKKKKEIITMLTSYDYPTAVIEDKIGIDIIFVGDSVGTNVLGYKSEKEVTMGDMVHHLKAVRRGVKNAYLLVDMPYQSYTTKEQALENTKLFVDAGADGVKMEGYHADIVQHLHSHHVDVIGHLGCTPQTTEKKVQGTTADKAIDIIRNSIKLEEVGIKFLVLEAVPEKVAQIVQKLLRIPLIGIAAGRYCDGQVLVINDMLGINDFKPKHVKSYEELSEKVFNAVNRYKSEVESRSFPQKEHGFLIKKKELEKIMRWVQKEHPAFSL